MEEIKKGDLVLGVRPWNDFARVGVVISELTSRDRNSPKCRVFWYAPEKSDKLTTKRVFVLDEMVDSIQKLVVENCDV